jgi:hypothetical protein
MFGKHADVNSFLMLAIDQEVFYIEVEASKKMLSVRVLDTPKAIEPRKFVSMGGHGCIYAPRRPFFKIRFQNRGKRI